MNREPEAERALELRNLIKQEIETLNQPSDADVESSGIAAQLSNAGVPFPYAVTQLSDPAVQIKLKFPFIGDTMPKRFHKDPKDDKWFYVEREVFVKLVNKFQHVQENRSTNTLLVYGAKGYGKSHLLAVLVCYLAAQGERVVYIPDCLASIANLVQTFVRAMLFAWADDYAIKDQIIKLNSPKTIGDFLSGFSGETVFVFDQMNALEESDSAGDELRKWLLRYRGGCKAIFSSSANYRTFLQLKKENNIEPLKVQGGFTNVSLDENNCSLKGFSNCDLDGNGALVEAP